MPVQNILILMQVLSFPPIVAPTKILIVPISTQEWWAPTARRLSNKLRALGISNRVDYSATSIRRYARNDELGTPFGLTVDFRMYSYRSMLLRKSANVLQLQNLSRTTHSR